MKHVQLESSNIKSVGYDLETAVLEIEFVSGGRYRYLEVSMVRAAQLVFADSPGSYFAKFVKPHHECEKLEPAAQEPAQ